MQPRHKYPPITQKFLFHRNAAAAAQTSAEMLLYACLLLCVHVCRSAAGKNASVSCNNVTLSVSSGYLRKIKAVMLCDDYMKQNKRTETGVGVKRTNMKV